ncbi:hypothetical protein B0H14DRAFT_2628775 [Mycena olivaceomarginata]|nr:hypothetical protein B0H14DRAFT_2628775 [Mycena olivaceomarginata]
MEVVTSCSPGQGAENERDRPWKREGKVGWKESDEKRRYGERGLTGRAGGRIRGVDARRTGSGGKGERRRWRMEGACSRRRRCWISGTRGRICVVEVRRTGSGGGIVVSGEGQLQMCDVGKREGGATQGQTNVSRGRGTRRGGGSVLVRRIAPRVKRSNTPSKRLRGNGEEEYDLANRPGDPPSRSDISLTLPSDHQRPPTTTYQSHCLHSTSKSTSHENLLHRHLLFCAPSTSIFGSGSRANTTAPTHWQPDFVWLKLREVEHAQRGDVKNYNESASMARVSHNTALLNRTFHRRAIIVQTLMVFDSLSAFMEVLRALRAKTPWSILCIEFEFPDSSAAKCLFFYFPEARAARKKWQERSSHGIITSFGRVVSPILSKKPIEVRGNK